MSEQIAVKITELCFEAWKSVDDTECELAQDLTTSAIKYTKYRMDFAINDNSWKMENDKYRTSAHNHYMDCLNIFLRYIGKQGKETPDLGNYDRKDLGDIACYLAYKAAISER